MILKHILICLFHSLYLYNFGHILNLHFPFQVSGMDLRWKQAYARACKILPYFVLKHPPPLICLLHFMGEKIIVIKDKSVPIVLVSKLIENISKEYRTDTK